MKHNKLLINKKNRTIRIFTSKYKLQFVDKIEAENQEDFAFGNCNSARSIIKVSTKGPDGKPLSDDIIKQSLLHELIHAILNEGQYLAYSDDEPLVEWLAKCIKHLIDQKLI